LSFFPVLGTAIHAIPGAVIGGISILLFGMISGSGIKSLVSDKVDMSNYKNMIIVSAMLIIGVGGAIIDIGGIQLSSLFLAALVGIVLNVIFNLRKKEEVSVSV
jgi:uracil permease